MNPILIMNMIMIMIMIDKVISIIETYGKPFQTIN